MASLVGRASCRTRSLMKGALAVQAIRPESLKSQPICSMFMKLTLTPCQNHLGSVSSFHTSSARQDLREFFDDKEVWSESKVNVGRPWTIEELRIKSNSDLHKLWYVLLKERNMVFTMEEEYKREMEIFPNPERIENVEETMENLLAVIDERDEAYRLLETGQESEKRTGWRKNPLGMWQLKKPKEHYVPKHKNPGYMTALRGEFNWQIKYKKLYEEKIDKRAKWGERRRKVKEQEMEEVFEEARRKSKS